MPDLFAQLVSAGGTQEGLAEKWAGSLGYDMQARGVRVCVGGGPATCSGGVRW